MKNIDAVERFEQARGAKIERLYWIPGSLENRDLKYLLKKLDLEEWNRLFPEISDISPYMEYEYELQALIDYEKFGFLAEIHVPKTDGFTFKDKKLVGWNVKSNICNIYNVYAETTDKLMKEIEKVAKISFDNDLKYFKSKEYQKV